MLRLTNEPRVELLFYLYPYISGAAGNEIMFPSVYNLVLERPRRTFIQLVTIGIYILRTYPTYKYLC